MEKIIKLTPICELKGLLKKLKLNAYIIPSNDEFRNQFENPDRLAYISGFTGSAGTAIVTNAKCHFVTDGRYTEQAARELAIGFQIINKKDCSLEKWLLHFIAKGNRIGFDPRLHTIQQIQSLHSKLHNKAMFVPITKNLVDLIRKPNNAEKLGTISVYGLKYSGQSSISKKKNLIDHLTKQRRYGIVLTDPTSICWLLNIRAIDIPFSPCMNAYLVVRVSGQLELFTNANIASKAKTYLNNNSVSVLPIHLFEKTLERLKDKKIHLSGQAPYFIVQRLKNYALAEDPCLLPKACKNKIELQGAVRAGARDSKALMNFFNWLKGAVSKEKLTELDVVEKLVQFRSEQEYFVSPSFPSIVGINENAALAHYLPNETTNKEIKGNGLLLIDSGGQYLDGTTDMTRTIAIGFPTAEQIHNFTLVLKSHINLITAVFPERTCGSQLDTLARIALWKEGKDYDHGTGHGVGSFLGIHEGPQNIVKQSGAAPLQEGMIVSIEPGFYKLKCYGIRIENLAYVKKSNFAGYLTFEVLTYVPIDNQLIDFNMLTEAETIWVKKYDKKCYEISKYN